MESAQYAPNSFPFLKGGGEMGELIRQYDWSTNELGTPDKWPQSLRTTVGIVTTSKFPMFIWWGPNHICFYNDAYRPSLGNNGKHPDILGMKAIDAWPEIWDFIKPLMDKVLTTQESVWFENQLLPIYRNQRLENVYWTFSYSPVLDEDNNPAGVLVTCTETTDKVLSTRQLEESERKYRSLFDSIDDGFCIIEKVETGPNDLLDFRYLEANPAFAKQAGAKSVIGKTVRQTFPEEEGNFLEVYDTIIKTGETKRFERHLVSKGLILEVLAFRPHKGVPQVAVLFKDITNRKKSEEYLKKSEEQYRDLLVNNSIGTALFTGREMTISLVNEAMLNKNWFKDRSVIGKTLNEALPELVGQPFLQIMQKVYDTGVPYTNPVQQADVIKDGRLQTGFFSISFKPLHNEHGDIYGIINTAYDVTELIGAQQKIEESEKRFRSLIEEAPVATCLFVGKEMKIEVANDMMLGMWGKEKEVIGMSLLDGVPELEGQPFLKILDEVYESAMAYSANEAEAQLKVNGKLSTYYFNFTYKPLFDTNGEVYGIMDMAVDVTEQVIAAKKLEESEKRFRTMAEGTDLLIAVGDQTSNAIYFNKAWTQMTGRPMSELIEYGWADLIHEEDRQPFIELFLAAYKIQAPWKGEFRIKNRQDEYIWLLAQGTPRFADNGIFEGYISASIDITVLIESRTKIEQVVAKRTQELEKSNAELAQFAYIASHDLQEPLRKINTFSQMLETSLGDGIDASSANFLTKIKTSCSRMSALIRDVLVYSQISGENEQFEKVDLNKVLANVMSDYDLLIEQKGALVRYNALPTIEAVSLQMNQLFTNLLGNALKFIRKDTSPIITVAYSTLYAEDIKANSLLPHYDYISIKFIDNGIGIGSEYAEKIFNIFHRLHSKAEYQGTGIGLALCKKIALNHHGDIYVESEEGSGSTFTIILPVKQGIS